ncbi:MAG: hypothetical protein ABIQ99_18615 [Thermoflexales bacterium]
MVVSIGHYIRFNHISHLKIPGPWQACLFNGSSHAMLARITMINLTRFEIWFVTGSQHLYGPEVLLQVAEHSQHIAAALEGTTLIPYIPSPIIQLAM